jgi:hypothetical protein
LPSIASYEEWERFFVDFRIKLVESSRQRWNENGDATATYPTKQHAPIHRCSRGAMRFERGKNVRPNDLFNNSLSQPTGKVVTCQERVQVLFSQGVWSRYRSLAAFVVCSERDRKVGARRSLLHRVRRIPSASALCLANCPMLQGNTYCSSSASSSFST